MIGLVVETVACVAACVLFFALIAWLLTAVFGDDGVESPYDQGEGE